MSPFGYLIHTRYVLACSCLSYSQFKSVDGTEKISVAHVKPAMNITIFGLLTNAAEGQIKVRPKTHMIAPAKNHDCDMALSVFMHIFQEAYEGATKNYEIYPPSLKWPFPGLHRANEYSRCGWLCSPLRLLGRG